MNQRFSYYLNIILSVGLLLFVLRYGCNPAYKDKPIVINEVADSNAIYDYISSEFEGKKIKYLDSIDKLKHENASLKVKYFKSVSSVKVSPKLMLTVDPSGDIIYNGKKYLANYQTDSSCYYSIEYANYYIKNLDSTLQIQSRGLTDCLEQNKILDNQVKYNKASNTTLLLENVKLKNELEKQKRKRKGCIRIF